MNGQSLKFDWDAGNRNHLARHDVKPQEAEEVVLGDLSIRSCKLRRGAAKKNGFCNLARQQRTDSATAYNVAWRKSESDLRMGRAQTTQAALSGRNEAALWKH